MKSRNARSDSNGKAVPDRTEFSQTGWSRSARRIGKRSVVTIQSAEWDSSGDGDFKSNCATCGNSHVGQDGHGVRAGLGIGVGNGADSFSTGQQWEQKAWAGGAFVGTGVLARNALLKFATTQQHNSGLKAVRATRQSDSRIRGTATSPMDLITY